jgi:hypothetical protein
MCAVVFVSVIAAPALPISAQATEAETVDEVKRKIKVCTVAIERAEKEIKDLEATKERKVEQGRLIGKIKRLQGSVETRTTALATCRKKLAELQAQLGAAGDDKDESDSQE